MTEILKHSKHLTRLQIVEAAFTWIDTPYQHQASVKQAGCDCLGLIRGIWREFYGREPMSVPPYTANWAEENGQETLLHAAEQCLQSCLKSQTQAGDVILFRMQAQSPVKHMAIMSAPDRIIHAYWGRAVVESFLVPYWIRRWSHSFSFPGLD